MNIAIATALTDNYVPLFVALCRSIAKNTTIIEQKIPHYVFHFATGLNDINKALLLSINPNIEFVQYSEKLYETHNKNNPRFSSIETFTLSDYDRVYYFDADLLILKDIQELLELDGLPIAMVKEEKRDSYNAGMIIIDKQFLNDETYTALLKHPKTPGEYGTDQNIYNGFFKEIAPLPAKYNTLVNSEKNIKDVSILHFIYKPHFTYLSKRINNKSLINLWNSYYNGKEAI